MALDAHDDGLLSVDGFRIDLRREERKMSNAWREGTFIFPPPLLLLLLLVLTGTAVKKRHSLQLNQKENVAVAF